MLVGSSFLLHPKWPPDWALMPRRLHALSTLHHSALASAHLYLSTSPAYQWHTKTPSPTSLPPQDAHAPSGKQKRRRTPLQGRTRPSVTSLTFLQGEGSQLATGGECHNCKAVQDQGLYSLSLCVSVRACNPTRLAGCVHV